MSLEKIMNRITSDYYSNSELMDEYSIEEYLECSLEDYL